MLHAAYFRCTHVLNTWTESVEAFTTCVDTRLHPLPVLTRACGRLESAHIYCSNAPDLVLLVGYRDATNPYKKESMSLLITRACALHLYHMLRGDFFG